MAPNTSSVFNEAPPQPQQPPRRRRFRRLPLRHPPTHLRVETPRLHACAFHSHRSEPRHQPSTPFSRRLHPSPNQPTTIDSKMAPNTSSVFNEAPPQPQQPESKPGDAGVLVAPPPQVASAVAAPSVSSSSSSALDAASSVAASAVATSAAASSLSGTSASVASTATSSAMATAAASVSTTSASLPATLRVDECVSGCFRRRRRQLADAAGELEDEDDASSADEERAAAALAASERLFQQQLQLSRFARVSPAALDGIKPTLGFRKSCLKRSNSELPADLSALKREAAALTAAAVVVEEPAAPARPVQKNRRRCWECKAKVGLTAVTCRCEYTFCNKHRYAEEHKCTFDFKVSAKRKLEEENPRVVPSKVARIN